MGVYLANADWLVQRALAAVLEPPPPLDYLDWAERNVVFTARESPLPGPYNRALFRHFDEILVALGPDDPCRIVTLAKSAQIGGTVLANIFTLGTIDLDPGDVLYTHPTDDNARRWSRLKLSPMLASIGRLKALFAGKSRDGGDSILYKERKDRLGAIQISGANSPASLSQVTMRRQVQDDLAKWEMNAAGDPEAQADSRSRAHPFAKIFKVSTPLVLPGCRITKNLEAGSHEVPEVPCPQCDAFQVLTWDNMLSTLDEAHPEAAHFTCEVCGFPIEEYHRPEMLSRLRWTAKNPGAKREHRSFWIWSAYSPTQSFELIAREWLKAKGDPAAEQVFLNDTCGLAFRTAGEAVPWEGLRDRAAQSHYIRRQVPPGGLILTVGIDCQQDRVEFQVVAWGRDLRRWVVEYGVIPGHISEAATMQSLDGLVEQTWRNSVGRWLRADLVAIDGNAWTEDVWDWARRWPMGRVIMVRGANQDSAPLLARVKRERNRAGKLLRYASRFYNFGTSVLKMALYRNLAKQDELERGYIGFPQGLEDEYFRQLTAERRKPVKQKSGFTTYQWVKDPNQANEGLDTMLQAEAAAIRLGVRSFPDAQWLRLENERETPPAGAQGQLDLEDLPAFGQAQPSEAGLAEFARQLGEQMDREAEADAAEDAEGDQQPADVAADQLAIARSAAAAPVPTPAPASKPKPASGLSRLAALNRRGPSEE